MRRIPTSTETTLIDVDGFAATMIPSASVITPTRSPDCQEVARRRPTEPSPPSLRSGIVCPLLSPLFGVCLWAGHCPGLSYLRPVPPVWSSFPDGWGFRDRPRWSATQLQKSEKLELRGR